MGDENHAGAPSKERLRLMIDTARAEPGLIEKYGEAWRPSQRV